MAFRRYKLSGRRYSFPWQLDGIPEQLQLSGMAIQLVDGYKLSGLGILAFGTAEDSLLGWIQAFRDADTSLWMDTSFPWQWNGIPESSDRIKLVLQEIQAFRNSATEDTVRSLCPFVVW